MFGKNGTGKTTLIHALHKALSFIMYSDKEYAYEMVRGKRKRVVVGVKTIANNNPYLSVEGYSRNGDYNNHEDPLIEIEANASLTPDRDINWSMSAFATNNRLRSSEFIDAFRTFYDWHKSTGSLPVIAYYSDCFPHKEDTKKDTGKRKIAKLRNFGYFDWNAVEGCTKEWINRLENNIFNIRQSRDLIEKLTSAQNPDSDDGYEEVISVKRGEMERLVRENDAVESCLKSFSNRLILGDAASIELAGVGIHSENHNLCVETRDGNEISFLNLPSGYKRLFNIVLDLAYRSYILSDGETTDVPGIAIIDEIDLHLHPELENVALKRLMDVFPHIQFIVSTHSINLLTSINSTDGKTKIVMMPPLGGKPEYFDDIYGIDANSGLQEIMGVTLNGEELKRLIAQCAYMYANNLVEQGNRLKSFIMDKNLISNDELNRRIGQKLNDIT